MNEFDTKFYRIVGRKMRDLRIRGEYSLEFVAKKLGSTAKTVQRYEVGERKIDAKKLKIMVECLGGDYDEFISGVQDEQLGRETPITVSDEVMSAEKLAFIEKLKDMDDTTVASLNQIANQIIAKRGE